MCTHMCTRENTTTSAPREPCDRKAKQSNGYHTKATQTTATTCKAHERNAQSTHATQTHADQCERRKSTPSQRESLLSDLGELR